MQIDFDISEKPIPDNTSRADSNRGLHVKTRRTQASSESLVNVATTGLYAESCYSKNRKIDLPFAPCYQHALQNVWCRASITDMLILTNSILRPYGFELLVLDGYRPLDVQHEVWKYSMENIRRQTTGKSYEESNDYTSLFFADPREYSISDVNSWPTHLTGGAVDVTLVDIQTRSRANMGSEFDEPVSVSLTHFLESQIKGTKIDLRTSDSAFRDAIVNRRLLYWAMTCAGFANYPYEWWHFDWGTPMWIKHREPDATNGDHPNIVFYMPIEKSPEG
jgi:D-alanyl-D-alanine dipeptidase